jgi:hypothetical protein
MEKSNKKLMALLVIVSLALLFPNICFAYHTVTYVWKNCNEALIIDGGHKMKKGDLTVKVVLSSDFLESAKKTGEEIVLYVKKKGSVTGSYCKFFLKVNGNK